MLIDRITFVKKAALSGEEKIQYIVFKKFSFHQEQQLSLSVECAPKVITFKLGVDCGGQPQQEAVLSTDAKRYLKFWRSHIGVSQGGELERETMWGGECLFFGCFVVKVAGGG